MSLQVGELFAKIGLDDKAYNSGLAKAKAGFNKLGLDLDAQSGKMKKSIAGIGQSLGALAGISAITAGAIVGSTIKIGMEFEAAMSNIKALGGATAEEMKQLHDLALEQGALTKFSALEAAQGEEELYKAGVSVQQILKGGLKGTLSLAAAGEIEVAEAAEIASTALNAFKKDCLTVPRAADILAGAANASATDVRELKLALAAVAPVAAGMGMSFEDTNTGLAVFANNGLKGSDAGTSLKTMLMNLQPSTKAQIKLFERLNLLSEDGTSLFYDEKGQMKKLADIAGLLRDRTKGMTDAQRAMTFEVLFGSDAIRAANILYKEGAEGVNAMNDAMNAVTADQVAAEKMNNLKGSIDNLRGSLETLAVKMYETEAGPLKKLVDGLTGLINAFGNLPAPVQQGAIIFGMIALAIAPIGWGLSQIAGAATVVGPAFKFMGQIIWAVLSGALKGVLDFGKTLLTVGKWVGQVMWAGIPAALKAFGQTLLTFGGWLMRGLGGVFSWIARVAIPLVMGALEGLAAFFGLSVGWMVAIIAGLVVAGYMLVKHWDDVKAFFARIWSDIKAAWGPNIAALKRGIWDLGNTLKNMGQDAYQWGASLITRWGQGIKDAFAGVKDDFTRIKNVAKLTLAGESTVLMSRSDTGQSRGLKGFASGTNFAPGGWSWVGENGPELRYVSRGEKILSHSQSMAAMGQSLTVGGEITVRGVNDLNQTVGVAKIVATEMERGDRRLAGRIRTMPIMP